MEGDHMINFKHIVGGWLHETSKDDEGNADALSARHCCFALKSKDWDDDALDPTVSHLS